MKGTAKKSSKRNAPPESGTTKVVPALGPAMLDREKAENAALSPVRYPHGAEMFERDTLRSLVFRAACGREGHGGSVAASALATLSKELHLLTWRIENEGALITEDSKQDLANDVAEIAYRADAWADLDRKVCRAEREAKGEPRAFNAQTMTPHDILVEMGRVLDLLVTTTKGGPGAGIINAFDKTLNDAHAAIGDEPDPEGGWRGPKAVAS